MEAVAKHDFNATSEDELSFRKHQVLIVTNKEDETYWYRAELDGRKGVIPYNYVELKKHDWYYGKITRADAEKLLMTKHDGAFLIRVGEAAHGFFSLSVKCSEGVQHFKVLRDVQGKFFLWMTKFYSLNALVQHYHHTSVLQTRDIRLKDLLSNEVV